MRFVLEMHRSSGAACFSLWIRQEIIRRHCTQKVHLDSMAKRKDFISTDLELGQTPSFSDICLGKTRQLSRKFLWVEDKNGWQANKALNFDRILAKKWCGSREIILWMDTNKKGWNQSPVYWARMYKPNWLNFPQNIMISGRTLLVFLIRKKKSRGIKPEIISHRWTPNSEEGSFYQVTFSTVVISALVWGNLFRQKKNLKSNKEIRRFKSRFVSASK